MKFLRFFLFPFSLIYGSITWCRNLLYDRRILYSTSFQVPIIVVGNLSVGGTGKTPQVEYLVRLLKKTHRLSILSRGYGRATKGHINLNKNHTTLEVGDESLQYFKKFKTISVAVNENRVEGIQNLLEVSSPEIILLDDAYQHRKVTGSFSILLTKYQDLFVNDFLLPTGNLRESSNGANRANVIVVTKCPKTLSSAQQKDIKASLSKFKKPIFFSTITYANKIKGTFSYTQEQLVSKEVLLVTGIANPNPLVTYLKENKIHFHHLKYPDHHQFTEKNIKDIQTTFSNLTTKEKVLLTTEKDYMRLRNKLPQLSFLEIETTFLNGTEKEFNSLILNSVSNKN